jgi:hypothetical protein
MAQDKIEARDDTDYFFYLKTFAIFATAGGGALFLMAIVLQLPILANIGLGLAGTGVIVGLGLSLYRFFVPATTKSDSTIRSQRSRPDPVDEALARSAEHLRLREEKLRSVQVKIDAIRLESQEQKAYFGAVLLATEELLIRTAPKLTDLAAEATEVPEAQEEAPDSPGTIEYESFLALTAYLENDSADDEGVGLHQ